MEKIKERKRKEGIKKNERKKRGEKYVNVVISKEYIQTILFVIQ